MTVFLETERLLMRRFTAADVDVLVELDSDPEVIRFTPDEARSREEVVSVILPAFLRYYERFNGYGFWAAVEKSGGSFLGWFHFRPAPGAPIDEPELGYRLRVAAWGKGYATEGARALIDKGFTEFGVRRVTAGAMAANVASCRVLEKSGLRLVAADDDGGLEYALTRADWSRSRLKGAQP